MYRILMKEAAAIPGGRAMMLCDADGEPVPMQTSTELRQAVGEASTITITLHIDGEQVVLG